MERLFVASVLLTVLHVCGGVELMVSPSGTQIRTLHSNIFITCELVGRRDNDDVDIDWYGLDDEPITSPSGRVSVETEGLTSLRLYIRNTTQADSGSYTCRASHAGRPFAEQVHISLYEDISFASTPNIVEYELGSSPLLQCTATGKPAPTISWRFKLRLIREDNLKYTYENDGLRINDIGLRDNGTYECRAEVLSQGSVKVKHISLNVLYAPRITQAIEVTPMIVGRRAVFTCAADGNPMVKYEWYREQQTEEWARATVKIGQGSRLFVIKEVSMRDEGRYICKVSNKLGEQEMYTDVVISVTPEVTLKPAANILEGNTLMLDCRVQGIPPPQLTWRNAATDEEYLPGMQANDNRISVDNAQPGKTRFIIQGVRRSDTGGYSCTAENSVGADEKTSQVVVEFAPDVIGPTTEALGWGGQLVNFTCSATGLPLPSITWIHANRVLTDSDIYTISTSTVGNEVISTMLITIKRVQQWVYGDYECGAKSKHGYVKHEMQLRQIFTPDVPHNITVIEEGTSSVLLAASIPMDDGGLPVTSWLVEYEPVPKQLQEEDGTTSSEFHLNETLEIIGLRPGTPYNFYLSAGNVVGFGEPVKFRVRTVRKQPSTEQADVPTEEEEVKEEVVKETNSSIATQNEMLRKGGMKPNPLEPTLVKESTADENAAPPVAIIIGAVVAVAVLIVIIVGIVMFKRKSAKRAENLNMYGYAKRRAAEQNGSLVTVNEAKDVDNIQLEIRKANALPDLGHHKPSNGTAKSPHESRKTSIVTVASPLPGRVCTEKLSQMNAGVSQSSIQQQAWTQMMRVALTSDDELEDEDEEVESHRRLHQPATEPDHEPMDTSPIMELPPPPAFLLEQEAARQPEVDDDSYQDILDGYYSGDNVEEDDDHLGGHVTPNHHS